MEINDVLISYWKAEAFCFLCEWGVNYLIIDFGEWYFRKFAYLDGCLGIWYEEMIGIVRLNEILRERNGRVVVMDGWNIFERYGEDLRWKKDLIAEVPIKDNNF